MRQGNQKVGFCWVVVDECIDRAFKPSKVDEVCLRVRGSEHVNGPWPTCGVGLHADGEVMPSSFETTAEFDIFVELLQIKRFGLVVSSRYRSGPEEKVDIGAFWPSVATRDLKARLPHDELQICFRKNMKVLVPQLMTT